MAITQVSNSLVKQDLTISGGTVDNTVIGSGTPAAGTFTTVAGTLASTVTGTTAAASDNSTKIATTAYVTTAIANLVDSAPGTLNTLNELAAALGDDASFATTVTNSIATKLPLAGGTLTGATTINGGNPALVISNSGDAKVNFVRSSNNISYSMTTSASGGHGFYDNATSAYDLYMKNGLVGIGGVTNPARELEVTGSGNVYIRVTASTANDSAAIELKNTGETWTIANDDTNSDTLEFRTSGGTPLVVDTSGNVGIGTSSPTGLLHVVGSGSTVPIKIDNTGTGGTTWRIWSTNNSASDGGGKLGFYNEDTASRIMTLENTGNVGIGTNDPSHRLEINTSTSGQSDVLLLTNENTATNNTAGILFAPSNGITGARIEALATEDFSTNANRTADLLFYTRKDGTLAESMRIDSSGNLAVGSGSYTNSQYYAKDLLLNAANEGGMTIASSANTHAAYIMFADGVSSGSEQYAGYIEYNHSANRFRVKSSGTFQVYSPALGADALTVGTYGNVGIGTSTLNKIFNIADPAQGGETLKLHFEANSSGDKWGIYSYDRTNSHYADLYLGQQAIYIKGSNSRVGIGTTAPANPLVVKDGTNVDMEFLSETNGTGIQSYNRTSANYGYIRFLTNTETMRLDTSGNLILGDDIIANGAVQGGTLSITKKNQDTALSILSRSSTTTHSAVINLQSTTSTTGAYTATGSGRELGAINFRGVDSAGVAREGAAVYAAQSGGAVSGKINGELFFRTADTIRQRIGYAGRYYYYGKDGTNGNTGSWAFGHADAGSSNGYLSSWTNVFGHTVHIRTNNGASPANNGTTTLAGSSSNNFRIMQNIGYNGVYWNAGTDTGRGTSTETAGGAWYWTNTNSVASGQQYTTTNRMRLDVNGNLVTTGSMTPNTSISDLRLKQDIEDLPSAIEKVKALRAVTFNWIDEERRGEHKEIGLIAQEVKEIYPQMVDSTDFIGAKENEETLEKEGGEERYFMYYEKLSVVLLKAMQEQQEMIEALQAEVTALKGE